MHFQKRGCSSLCPTENHRNSYKINFEFGACVTLWCPHKCAFSCCKGSTMSPASSCTRWEKKVQLGILPQKTSDRLAAKSSFCLQILQLRPPHCSRLQRKGQKTKMKAQYHSAPMADDDALS
ncbi:hypothetical protein BS78_01G510600 [Paspalum vaginatum]|nr:hypothetical protein BS78_01G510600 [Paspalum vaginatum]